LIARPITYQVDKNPLQRTAGPYIGSEAAIGSILKATPRAPVNRKPSTILGHEANNVLQVHPHADRGV
jgi:hypothetical protein